MRILISVSNKDGIVDFVRKLDGEVIATYGTAKFLQKHGIQARKVSDLTGFEESRELKTLHSSIYSEIFFGKIGMVVVNLYPFEEYPSIDNIDIGGVTLLRAAAKNYDKVIVVSSPEQYGKVISKMDNVTEAFRLKLAYEAFECVARYDRTIAQWFKEKVEE